MIEGKTIIIDVACALIRRNDHFLAVRRSQRMPHPGKWEFPGGKIEPEETSFECIVREIREELGLDVKPTDELWSITWHYPEKFVRLIPIVCEIIGGELRLTEHDQMQWIDEDHLKEINWTDADRAMLKQNCLIWD
jgi:8-oxo-dGTP diphosphatase